MNAPLARGACPSLSAPMQTGDGLLVRLNQIEGLTPEALAGLADAAARFGNGMIEVTARGSLQIRGLNKQSAAELAVAVDALRLRIRTGVPVETGPLAGLDPTETADARPLAEEIRRRIADAGMAERLGPKVSVAVDGGGRLNLAEVIADVRLEAKADERWLLAIGGNAETARTVGVATVGEAVEAVVEIFGAIAAKGRAARARDLGDSDLASIASHPTRLWPAGRLPLGSAPIGDIPLRHGDALGIGLAFGQSRAQALSALARAARNAGCEEIRLSPGRALLFLGLAGEPRKRLRAVAKELGFVSEPNDRRLAIVACAGAPACASAHARTRAVAAAIAEAAPQLFDGSFRLHVSGCAKRCAEPARRGWTLVGEPGGHFVIMSASGETVGQAPAAHPEAVIAALIQQAGR